MIRVGATSWVEPSKVVGIKWDGYSGRYPLILLEGGHEVKADSFEIPRDAGNVAKQRTQSDLMRSLNLL